MVGNPEIHGLQQGSDQTHVVEEGQPAGVDGQFISTCGAAYHLFIVHDVAVADHDAFGGAGGAGRVLEKGEALRGDIRPFPVVFFVRDLVGHDPFDLPEVRHFGKHRAEAFINLSGGQGEFRPGVQGYGANPRKVPVVQALLEPGGVGGHGDCAAVQASEKSGDVIHPRGVYQESALLIFSLASQQFPYCTGLGVKLAVGDGRFFAFSVGKEHVGGLVRLMFGPAPQHVHKRVKFQLWFIVHQMASHFRFHLFLLSYRAPGESPGATEGFSEVA